MQSIQEFIPNAPESDTTVAWNMPKKKQKPWETGTKQKSKKKGSVPRRPSVLDDHGTMTKENLEN